MIIRPEEPPDFLGIFELNSFAFERDAEARLVEELRKTPGFISLVAEAGERIVGHIAFSSLTLNNEKAPFFGLAPMAVLPEMQRSGIGSALITESIAVVSTKGMEAIFVLGHPSYYPRFGFLPAKDWGFRCEYPDSDDSFMVLELRSGILAGRSGVIRYGPEFAMF